MTVSMDIYYAHKILECATRTPRASICMLLTTPITSGGVMLFLSRSTPLLWWTSHFAAVSASYCFFISSGRRWQQQAEHQQQQQHLWQWGPPFSGVVDRFPSANTRTAA
jgi:hypothetical protein